MAHARVGIAVACLLRTMNVDARTVPDQLNRRADNHAVRLTSWRLPCARFPRLRPFADDAATERSIAVPPETVKRPPAMMAKMPKSPLAPAAAFAKTPHVMSDQRSDSRAGRPCRPTLAATYVPADRYGFSSAPAPVCAMPAGTSREPPRGTVVVLTGRGEFIEKYATEVVGELLGRGYCRLSPWTGAARACPTGRWPTATRAISTISRPTWPTSGCSWTRSWRPPRPGRSWRSAIPWAPTSCCASWPRTDRVRSRPACWCRR